MLRICLCYKLISFCLVHNLIKKFNEKFIKRGLIFVYSKNHP